VNGRTPIAAVLVYLALMTWVIYGHFDPDKGGDAILVLVVWANVALGFLVPRWWAFIVPLALIVLSIPAGYPNYDNYERQEFQPPTWFWAAFYVPILDLLVGLGRGTRSAFDRLRARSS
jgi:hypothetical protein